MSPDPGAPSSAFESATSFCWVASSTKYAAAGRRAFAARIHHVGIGGEPEGTGCAADVARHGYEAQVWHRDHCGFLRRAVRSNRRPRPARRSSQRPARKCTSSSSGTPQRISCAGAFGMLFGRAESCLINARTQLAMHRQGGDRPSGHDHAILFGRKARSPEGTAGRSLRTRTSELEAKVEIVLARRCCRTRWGPLRSGSKSESGC